MSLVYDAHGDPRRFGLYFGLVVDNVDPQKMGRVTVTVPGLIEPASNWALPFGVAGGSPQNGGWNVPKVGASVGVMFHQGDVDEPIYLLGWNAQNELPTPAKEASAEDAANKIKCFESDRHLVVLDGVKNRVLIKDKATGNLINITGDKIELGGESLTPLQTGVLTGMSKDPFTGMDHWMLGNASNVVGAKK